MTTCPCGSKKEYAICCGPYINGDDAKTAEALMRSRYTAYTQANMAYIVRTMKGRASENFDVQAALAWAHQVEWLGLEVISSSTEENKAYVEFMAHFLQNKQRHTLHERSEFHLENNIWFYVDGKDPRPTLNFPAQHIGRNETCLCGSGKKYKKCCGSVQAKG